VVTAEGTTEPLIAALEDEGGYVLDANECDRLRDLLAGDGTELSSPVGNSPRWFASTLDLPPAADATAFLIVAGENLGKYPSENGERNEDEDAGDDPLAALPGIPAVTIHACEGFSARAAAGGRAGRITCRCGPHDATGAGPAGRGAARSWPTRRQPAGHCGGGVGAKRVPDRAAPRGGSREGSQLDGGLTATDLIETTSVSVTTVTDRAAHRNGAGETLRGP